MARPPRLRDRNLTLLLSFAETEGGLGLPERAGKGRNRHMGLIILIVVILLLVGAFPTGGYGWGYRSHGVLGTVVIIILILYLIGRL